MNHRSCYVLPLPVSSGWNHIAQHRHTWGVPLASCCAGQWFALPWGALSPVELFSLFSSPSTGIDVQLAVCEASPKYKAFLGQRRIQVKSWPVSTALQVSDSWEVICSCLIIPLRIKANVFCLVLVMNQSFFRYDVWTDTEKQPVCLAVRACWHLAERLCSGVGSSQDLWCHYGAVLLPRANQDSLSIPQKHHKDC